MRPATEIRHLTANEIMVARLVFKNALPYHEILISNGLGAGNHPCTIPMSMPVPPLFKVKGSGKFVMHVGDSYVGMSASKKGRQLLVHELTHVVQASPSQHSWNLALGLMRGQRVSVNSLKYDKNRLKDWNEYDVEQQASIIEDWYADGMKKTEREDLRFYYIKKYIWRENVSHDWIAAASLAKPNRLR